MRNLVPLVLMNLVSNVHSLNSSESILLFQCFSKLYVEFSFKMLVVLIFLKNMCDIKSLCHSIMFCYLTFKNILSSVYHSMYDRFYCSVRYVFYFDFSQLFVIQINNDINDLTSEQEYNNKEISL